MHNRCIVFFHFILYDYFALFLALFEWSDCLVQKSHGLGAWEFPISFRKKYYLDAFALER